MTTLDRNGIALLVALAFAPPAGYAFDSQSDGSNGDLTPTVNTIVELPPSGVLQYHTVNIPSGVTVRFKRNSANTPVVLLVQQDVTVTGVIDVGGSSAPAAGAAGDANVGDDGLPGLGGPGGFDGGRVGSSGLGPGGGGAGQNVAGGYYAGSGGGFATAGAPDYNSRIPGGAGYGSATLLPLVGGSGGGGGLSAGTSRGSGGGGGGGAILIAASGTVKVDGSILANGGNSGAVSVTNTAPGGGGAGGAIRIVAGVITGNGTLSAAEGITGDNLWYYYYRGGSGAPGRIRLESQTLGRTTTTTPLYSFDAPGPLFLADRLEDAPQLRITRVAGVDAPAAPTGAGDILLPANLSNPVTVEFETKNVPVGTTTVKLIVTPYNTAPITAGSAPLVGTTTVATASASVTLPPGPSVLMATTSYQVNAALGEALSRFANNERVESVRLTAGLGSAGVATLVTVSGKEYEVPLAALAALRGS